MRYPWVLAAGIAGSSMILIDATAVNVALPVMQRDLAANAAGLQWVIESYTLFLAALMLVGGALGDRFGRCLVFSTGIAIFTLASIACALAPALDILIVARCVQGIGAALATPGSLALLTAVYSGAERDRAIGIWSGASAIATAAAPLLGGWLTQAFSWRAVFLINVPLGIVVVAVAFTNVPESRDQKMGALDGLGSALVTAGLAALVYGLIRLQTAGVDSFAASAVAFGIALLATFAAYERFGAREPMMRPALFASRTFTGANLYTFFLYAALSGALYFVPFDLINVHGYSPLAAGAALLPFVLVLGFGSGWAGGLVARRGPRLPLAAGAILAAAGFAAFALPGTGGSYWTTFFPASLLLGAGGALFVAPLTATVMDAAPSDEAGIASGINNAVARTGGLLAIAVLGLILAWAFNASLDRTIARGNLSPAAAAAIASQRGNVLSGSSVELPLPRDVRAGATLAVHRSYVAGFRAVMLVATALALCSAGLAATWERRKPAAARS